MRSILTVVRIGVAVCLGLCLGCAQTPDPADRLARPTPEQAAWQDLELGAFYHFDFALTAQGKPAGYKLKAEDFNPSKLDTDQWLQAAKLMGAKYAVLTTKAGSGFLPWQSDARPFSCKQSKWRGGQGDVVRDFVNSCRKAGIKPGLYIHLGWDPISGVVGKVNWGKGGDPEKQREYSAMCEKVLTELWSNYGELAEIWFDGEPLAVEEGGPNILPLARKLQPKAAYRLGPVSTFRWGGNEDGIAGYPCWATVPSRRDAARDVFLIHGDPNGPVWLPAEADCPLPGHTWGWTLDQPDIEPLPELMEIYYKTVGRNSNLLLNVTPNADGLVPEKNLRHYAEFGKEIQRRFGKAVAETKGEGATLELYLPKPTNPVDHVILMEDITGGERVRRYVVEGLVAGQWQTLCEGISIGHKRIQRFANVPAVAVRLRVTESVGEPKIRRFAVFNVGPVKDHEERKWYE